MCCRYYKQPAKLGETKEKKSVYLELTNKKLEFQFSPFFYEVLASESEATE